MGGGEELSVWPCHAPCPALSPVPRPCCCSHRFSTTTTAEPSGCIRATVSKSFFSLAASPTLWEPSGINLLKWGQASSGTQGLQLSPSAPAGSSAPIDLSPKQSPPNPCQTSALTPALEPRCWHATPSCRPAEQQAFRGCLCLMPSSHFLPRWRKRDRCASQGSHPKHLPAPRVG